MSKETLNAETEKIVQALINGETVSILDTLTFCQVRHRLREIKKNCTTVLSQMKESLPKN